MSSAPVFKDLIKEESVPVVAIDHNSMFTLVNKAFTDAYGWTEQDLLGRSVVTIIPTYLRNAHLIGFSRFLMTEEITLMGRYLPLEILLKDEQVLSAEHYIVGEKIEGKWQFAASIELK